MFEKRPGSHRSSIFNQAANDVVVQRALNGNKTYHIPQMVTVAIYDTLLESMLAFECCSVSSGCKIGLTDQILIYN
jgi:hypothetical protein